MKAGLPSPRRMKVSVTTFVGIQTAGYCWRTFWLTSTDGCSVDDPGRTPPTMTLRACSVAPPSPRWVPGTETCAPAAGPLLPPVATTTAVVPAAPWRVPSAEALVAQGVAPRHPLVAAAARDAARRGTRRAQRGRARRGPPRPTPSGQSRRAGASTLAQCEGEGEQQHGHGPQGQGARRGTQQPEVAGGEGRASGVPWGDDLGTGDVGRLEGATQIPLHARGRRLRGRGAGRCPARARGYGPGHHVCGRDRGEAAYRTRHQGACAVAWWLVGWVPLSW